MTWWNRGITVAQLQQEMMGTTAVFGRDKSIKVTFDGETAVSEDGHVQFPAMDPTMVLDDATAKMFRGWVDSESALFRYADMDFYSSKKPLMQEQPLLYDLFKAIETSRVEADYTDVYVGAGKNLGQLAKDSFKLAENTFQQPHEFYPVSIQMAARARMPGTWLNWAKKDIDNHVELKKVEGWVDRIENECETTEDSFKLAEEILKDIKDNHPEEDVNQPKPQDGEGEGDEGDDGEGEKPITLESMMGEMVKKAIEEMSIDYSDKKDPYYVLTTEFDERKHWSDGWREDVEAYVDCRNEMAAELNTAKKKLELMIQATQKIAWDPMKEMGRFDSKRLVAAYQADPYVFKVKDDDTDLDTAIAISVDLSGSMSGRRAFTAMKTTVVLTELLDKIGVPFEVTGYDAVLNSPLEKYIRNKIDTTKDERKLRQFLSNKSRFEALRHHEFKRFGDRLFDARKYFWYIRDLEGSGHNNIDGESIQLAADSLIKRPEKRKIMFVISDGQPHGQGKDGPKFQHLKDTVKNLSKQIEIVGIGLETYSVEEFYPKNILVHDADNLPTQMMDLMKEHLLKTHRKNPVKKIQEAA